MGARLDFYSQLVPGPGKSNLKNMAVLILVEENATILICLVSRKSSLKFGGDFFQWVHTWDNGGYHGLVERGYKYTQKDSYGYVAYA